MNSFCFLAMTCLNIKMETMQIGASYLEIVDFIIQNGLPSKVGSDLEELWRRPFSSQFQIAMII